MNELVSSTANHLPAARKDAATYMGLFPDASLRCAPGALQANTSHAAYLVYLKELIEALETRADVAAPVTLLTRRPDLLQLKLDEKNAKKALPTLRLVLGLLESRARETLTANQTLQQTVASAVYRGSVPFQQAWESVKATLALKQLPLWDALCSGEIGHPSFIFDNLTRPAQRAATTLSSGFAPELQAKLLDASSANSPLNGLTTTQAVSKALGLTRKALRRLLAVSAIGEGNSSVALSPHASVADFYPGSSELYGAAYINNEKTPLYLTQPNPADTTVQITGVTDDHLARLQHIVHIQRALDLKPAETDTVVMAAIWAEDLDQDPTITAHTLRALGLFRHLQQQYAVSAHQFAAFICEIPIYGADGEHAFYDQLFAPQSTEDGPAAAVLRLDGAEFDPEATSGADALTIKQLCLAFKVDEPVLRVVLEWVVEAQGLTLPTRSIEVVSACYRLTALPRLFGMSPQAGMLALALLAQEDPAYKYQLAGTPSLGIEEPEADIVDVIVGMMQAMQWLQQQTWGVNQLYLSLQSETPLLRQDWVSICEGRPLDPGDQNALLSAVQQALQLENVGLARALLQWAGLDTQEFRASLHAIQCKHLDEQLPALDCFTEADIEDCARLEQYSAFVKLLGLDAGTLQQLLEKPEWFDLLDATGTVLREPDLTTAYLLTRYKALLARLPKDRNESDVTRYLADAFTLEPMTESQIAKAWTGLEVLLGEPKGSLAKLTSLAPPTTLGEIDRLLRLLDLSRQQRLSVDALVELGALPSASGHAPFQQAATALRQSCSAKQRKVLDEQLSVAWRDALVNCMLASWVPADSQRGWITTPQALADYLLIDQQVSHEPRTTRLASATASLQRYLHQVHSRQENGYRSTLFSEAERDEWENFASRYETWKLRQQVRNEPQNFIDPTRRTRKTTAFKQLENLLAQGKCQPQDIQAAMVGYLSTFETLSNIQPISAYADGASPLEDTYHFIGKTNVEPVEYYWRTLDLRQRDQAGAPSMLAWGEWEKIALPISGTLAMTPLPSTAPLQYIEPDVTSTNEVAAEDPKKTIAKAMKATEDALLEQDERTQIELIRPVIIAGRRYAVWVEWETTAIAMGPDNKPSEYYPLRVCFTYQQTDGAWSPPNELLRLDGHNSSGVFVTPNSESVNPFLKTKDYKPGLAVMVNNMGDRINDPWLTVLLFDNASDSTPKSTDIPALKTGNKYFIVSKDLLLLEHKKLDATLDPKFPIESRLVSNWLRFFRDPRVVQHPYVGPLMTLVKSEKIKNEWKGPSTKLLAVIELPMIPTFQFEQQPQKKHQEREIIISSDLKVMRKLRKSIIIISHPKYGDILQASLRLIGRQVGLAVVHTISLTMAVLSQNIKNIDTIGTSNGGHISVKDLDIGDAAIYTMKDIIHASYVGENGVASETSEKLTQLINNNFDFVANCRPEGTPTNLSVRLITHDLPISLSIRGPVANNATWTLSASEDKLLWDFQLQALKSFADDSQDKFNTFKRILLKNRRITESSLNRLLSLSDAGNFDISLTFEGAINKACTLNRADAINALVQQEVDSLNSALKTADIQLPDGLSLESTVRLRHLHPEACRKILLCLDPTHTLELDDQLSVKGDGRVVFRFPLSHDLLSYTFTLTVYDYNGATLGSASQDFEWKEQPDDLVPSVQLRRNKAQALYIDFTEANTKLADTRVASLRLNTLFGKQLVALATQSVERALSWEAQCLPEPALASANERSTVDFSSANGLYFWELFFHVPFLVTWQLRQNRQYREAWRWCTRHLFDPYRTWAPEGDYAPPYWLTQPISGPGAYAADEAENDPDLLAYAAPERYRKALHLFVADTWQRQGDDLYRQLTRDTLVEAAICYDKALRLIGALPEQFSTAPKTALALSEARSKDFVPPLNNKLIEVRDLLRNRLFNLRHGLTLDGKPSSVMLEPGSYNNVALGYAGPNLEMGSGIKVARPVPPCRYSEVRKSADAAVLQLIELGQTQLRFYESEASHKLALLSKSNIIKLLDFPRRLQEQALESAKRGRDTLLASKRLVEQRLGYYEGLVEVGITPLEEAAIGVGYWSQAFYAASIPFQAAAGITDAIPTIFGLAFGGSKPASTMVSLAAGSTVMGKILETTSNELQRQAGYQLRAQEWQFEADQAKLELRVIDQQLLEQDIHIRAANIAVEEARAKLAAHRAEFELMTTVFASHPTYLWLIGRMADIYSTAYDATLSLCLMAEACLQYELGDFRSTWIRTDGWLDNWRGMLAGEALERDLMQMDVAAITHNERPLDIRLDLSLCTCMGWTKEQLQTYLAAGEVPFNLTARHFDEQYPGLYLRRIERIVLTFKNGNKSLSGNIAALLTQTRNVVLLSNDPAGAQRLYSTTQGSEDNLLRDLRPNQQAAIWSAKEIHRNYDLQPSPKDETRYQPFEGTGAISSWVLSFPNGGQARAPLYEDDKCVVTDIEIQISYSAMEGGEAFRQQVKALLNKTDTAEVTEAENAEAEKEDEENRKAEAAAAVEQKREADAAAAAQAKRRADAAQAAEAQRIAEAAAAAEVKRRADAAKQAAEEQRAAEAAEKAAEAKRKADAAREAAEAKRRAAATAAVTAANQAEQNAKDSLAAAEADANAEALQNTETTRATDALARAREACEQATTARQSAEAAATANNAELAVTEAAKTKLAAKNTKAAAKIVTDMRSAAERNKKLKALRDIAQESLKAYVKIHLTNGRPPVIGMVAMPGYSAISIYVRKPSGGFSELRFSYSEIVDMEKIAAP
jgi:hypothetical protein